VVLFGPETPALFAPLGNRVHVIWAGLACSPCVSAFNHRLSPCRNNVCMQAITTDQVYDKVQEALAARSGAR
jgi:ADP-heptose:LPS heptosyltransferase